MKIARIVLTATILLSLKSTSYCSTEKATDGIQVQRKNSFDAARDGGALNGWLGWTPDALTNYTLTHLKEDYKGKEVRPGKCPKSQEIWDKYGKEKVTNLTLAQQFMAAITHSQLSISKEAIAPAQGFIDIENQRLEAIRVAELERIKAEKRDAFEHADQEYISLNQTSKAALQALYVKKTQTRKDEITALHKKYAALLKTEQRQIKAAHRQEDSQLALALTQNFNQLQAIRDSQNQKDSNINNQIRRVAFVESTDMISERTLGKLAYRYKDWQTKSQTYADALKSSSIGTSSSNQSK